MTQAFKNEENERRNVHDKLTTMKDAMKAMKMGSNCTVSSAASTGFLLGSGTFAHTLRGAGSCLERVQDVCNAKKKN